MAHAGRNGILLGREREREELDRFIDGVLDNQGSVVVIRGESGLGKTALLDYIAGRPKPVRSIRTTSVESEMELPYAGLQQLCAPLLSRLGSLPAPQGEALRVVFGLSNGEAASQFLVGLAVLNLMSLEAEDQPLICLIDDVQWLDRASVQVLTFVARRLLAEPIGMVFALRRHFAVPALDSFPHLALSGIGTEEAVQLLDIAFVGKVDEAVRTRMVLEARGNPLALLELPRSLTAAELAGGFRLPDVRPLESRIEQGYLLRAQALPPDTQSTLLIAAAEPTGDSALLLRALAVLGLDAEAVVPASAEGLFELGVQARFCHPLARSAIYRAAPLPTRREAHQALAQATDESTDPDRRAWHRAQAATAPDEQVADELARSANRARVRGGNAAAAAFLKRAVELTPSPGRRAVRALDAAGASFEAGDSSSALELLGAADLGPLDDLQRARSEHLRAQIEFARKRGTDTPSRLLEAAVRLAPLDAKLAREAYLEAFAAAIFAGRLDGPRSIGTAARAVRETSPRPEPARPLDLLLDGLALRFTEGNAAAAPVLKQALDGFDTIERGSKSESTRWLWLAWFVAGDLWDDSRWHGLADKAIALARESGALNVLPVSLESGAAARIHAGEFTAAEALLHESDSISEATGNAHLRYSSLLLGAWHGNEAKTLRMIDARVNDAIANGEGRVIGLAEYVKAVLFNGLGRYNEAAVAAQRGAEHDDLELCGFALVELIEATARTQDLDSARTAMARLEMRTRPAATDWALGVESRSRALLSDGEAAETLYLRAIEHLERSQIPIHLARARLLYGEWLRRQDRRRDARHQLRSAHDSFSSSGAEAFAERARRELLATGETARKRMVAARDQLTPQELQIARLAADRLSNPEIGSQLYLSPRTIEYHLHKVYEKLGINSRKELTTSLRGVN